MKSLYILTDAKNPHLHPDDAGLLQALEACGIKGIPVVWDKFMPSSHANILIRTPWDYTQKLSQFLNLLTSIEKQQAMLINSTDIVRWNLDKSYLLDLAKLGIAVVATKLMRNAHLNHLNLKPTDFPLVLKPKIGASGRDTFLVQHQAEIEKCTSLNGKDILMQPFISSIQDIGEFSFIFFDGVFSHAALKTAKLGEFRIQEEHGGRVQAYTPTSEEIETVSDYLKKIDRDFCYARVDLVKDKGQLLIMELEVIEPQLFFGWAPTQAMKAFANTIAKRII